MKPTKIYEEYAHVLRELTDLDDQFRAATKENDVKKRAGIEIKLKACRERLTVVTDELIHYNPFLTTRSSARRRLTEEIR